MGKLNNSAKQMIVDFVGQMHWHGDTYEDGRSPENMETAYELVIVMVDSIYDNATLAQNAVATSSGSRLNSRAIDMLKGIRDTCDEVCNE